VTTFGGPAGIAITAETDADPPAVAALVEAAFDAPPMARAVASVRDRAQVVVARVARRHDRPVGFVQVSPVTVAGVDAPLGGIVPVAVLPEMAGAGIGSALVRAAIAGAADAGVAALFVLGRPRFYARFGFTRSHLGNELGATRWFQHLELVENVLTDVTGTARYVPAFREAGLSRRLAAGDAR